MSRSEPGPIRRVLATGLPALLGLVIIVLVAVGTVGVWDVLRHGHPATPALSAVLIMVALIAIGWSVARGRADGGRPRDRGARRWRPLRILAGVLAWTVLVLSAATAGFLAYARPAAATPVALSALQSDAGVGVVEQSGWFELVPAESARPTPYRALIFDPGALVDARAYAAMLRPIAEAGVLVIIVKEPLGLALIPAGVVDPVIAAHPEVERWSAGGHSLGGTAAARTADEDDRFDRLLLWASYPGWPVRDGVSSLTVAGTNDGLFPPSEIESTSGTLPPDSEVVEVEGANHASFGDYGVQSGDGVVVGDRDALQQWIADASIAFLTAP